MGNINTLKKIRLVKSLLIITVFLMSTISSSGQLYRRGTVIDSIMTVGNNHKYLVLIDSTWKLCNAGNILNAPFDGTFTLFYPCYVPNSEGKYVKQTFELANGKIIHRSKIKRFPSDASPMDTINVNAESKNKNEVVSNIYSKKNSVGDTLPELKDETKLNSKTIDTLHKTKTAVDTLLEKINDANLTANMDALASHHKLTQFTDMDFNFVNLRIQNFMNDVMEYTAYGESSSDFSSQNKTITQKYLPKISSNNSKSFIQFKYVVIPNGNALTIKSCEISGNLNYLIEFYVSYWTTKINIEGRKEGEIVHNHLLNDDISFQFFPSTGKGKIVITRNQ